MPECATLGRSPRFCAGTVCERVLRTVVLHPFRGRVRRGDEAHLGSAREAGQHERVAEHGMHLRREQQGLLVVGHRVSGQDNATLVRDISEEQLGTGLIVTQKKKKFYLHDRGHNRPLQ